MRNECMLLCASLRVGSGVKFTLLMVILEVVHFLNRSTHLNHPFLVRNLNWKRLEKIASSSNIKLKLPCPDSEAEQGALIWRTGK